MRFSPSFCMVVVCLSGLSTLQAQPLTPEKSRQAFVLDAGLTIELVASEPQIVDPVAAVFDADGSLWVVQMGDYPHGPKEGEQPKSCIKRLQDKDGDGHFETSSTFADHLLFVTGVLPWKDGLIVTLAGEVAFLADRDGDGTAEHKETWFTGFTQENSQLRANHPTLGLDGYVYIANGLRGGVIRSSFPGGPGGDLEVPIAGRDFRFNPHTGEFSAVAGHGQFGLTFDEIGRRFVCSNRNPCTQIVFEERDLAGHPNVAVSKLVHDVAAAGETSRLYPLSKAWTTSTLHAGQFTAACGVTIFRNSGLGADYVGNVFTCDPTGNLVHREVIKPVGAVLSGHSPYENREFLASPDIWFRPVNLTQGPDGALYVVDMYRAVIEHPQFMPEELKNRPDLYLGIDRGRIWRVKSSTSENSPAASLVGKMPTDWVQNLGSDNAWVRETAFRLLAQTSPNLPLDQLRQFALSSTAIPYGRIAAIGLLNGAKKLTPADLTALLGDQNPRLREATLETAKSLPEAIPLDQAVWKPLAADPDARVRFVFATYLAAQPASAERLALAKILAAQDVSDEWLQTAIGLAADPNSTELFTAIVSENRPPSSLAAGTLALLERLGDTIAAERIPENFEQAMVALTGQADALPGRDKILAAGLKGLYRGATRRGLGWSQLVSKLPQQTQQQLRNFLEQQGQLAQQTGAGASSLQDRTGTIWLLRLASPEQASQILVPLAISSETAPVRLAALESLATCGAPDLAKTLLEKFPSETPTIRRAMLDTILSRNEELPELLNSLEQKRLQTTEVDPVRAQRLVKHRDVAIRERAEKLFANANADRQAVLKQYETALALSAKADPLKGKVHFEKNCVTCHKIGTLGINVGPDIGDTRDKTPAYLLTAILDPNRAVDNNYFGYTAVTVNGKVYTGLIVSETAENLTIRQPEGKQETLLREDLEELRASGLSLMPVGLEKTLTVEQMAELISFLKNWRYLDGDVPVGSR